MNTIFVFGSNLAGRHGKGAAYSAARYFGAETGVGTGLTGKSYAIPTKDEELHTLPLHTIHQHVADFLSFASNNQEKKFLITRIGCGLAGYQDSEIAPFFLYPPSNCDLPGIWLRNVLKQTTNRVIVAGSRTFLDYPRLESVLDHILIRLHDVEIVSGGARGADSLGERYALSRNLALLRMPADWDRFGKSAGYQRNMMMARYATHLVAFWDRKSNGTEHMIRTAKECGLNYRVC